FACVFPGCVASCLLFKKPQHCWGTINVVAYLAIGFPLPVPDKAPGLSLLLCVPRLPLMMAVLCAIYALMWPRKRIWDWSHYAWSAAMIISVLLSVRSTFRLQQGE